MSTSFFENGSRTLYSPSAFMSENACLLPLELNAQLICHFISPQLSPRRTLCLRSFHPSSWGSVGCQHCLGSLVAPRARGHCRRIRECHNSERETLAANFRAAEQKIIPLPSYVWDICYSKNIHGCCVQPHNSRECHLYNPWCEWCSERSAGRRPSL